MTAPIGRRPYEPDDSDTAPVEEVSTRGAASDAPAVLLVGRYDSRCGACGKAASPYDTAHTTPIGYFPEPGCGAVWTHVVSLYAGADSEQATRNLRPDLTYGTPTEGAPDA